MNCLKCNQPASAHQRWTAKNLLPHVSPKCIGQYIGHDPLTTESATIKRATLFDGVIDSFSTETELNGWKPTQGALLL